METRPRTIPLDSVEAYNHLYGLETLHPLVAVIDLKKAKNPVNHVLMNYGVYALYLKNGENCTVKYGRASYDYQEGTVVSFAPGQLVGVESESDVIQQDVIGLLFHPDLIFGTPLGEMIGKYSFFDYSQREALHLSEQERKIFMECLERIRQEIEYPIDPYSADIISSHIQTLLDYLNRFYSRQFITRRKVNKGILAAFEKQLKEYYTQGRGREYVPTVAYFAANANLTPGYFGDLIKKETGSAPQELISRYVIMLAKQRLAFTDDDVGNIAYDLGFQYPQHFSRLFKRLTDLSPSDYRKRILSKNKN